MDEMTLIALGPAYVMIYALAALATSAVAKVVMEMFYSATETAVTAAIPTGTIPK